MVSYVNVHGILEGRRGRAKKSPSDDPVLSQVILLCLVVRRLDALMCLFVWIIFSFLHCRRIFLMLSFL